MATEMYYAAGALAALVVGILTYVATRRRDVEDDRQKLFDDALALAEAHKDAWRKATDELEGLREKCGGGWLPKSRQSFTTRWGDSLLPGRKINHFPWFHRRIQT